MFTACTHRRSDFAFNLGNLKAGLYGHIDRGEVCYTPWTRGCTPRSMIDNLHIGVAMTPSPQVSVTVHTNLYDVTSITGRS